MGTLVKVRCERTVRPMKTEPNTRTRKTTSRGRPQPTPVPFALARQSSPTPDPTRPPERTADSREQLLAMANGNSELECLVEFTESLAAEDSLSDNTIRTYAGFWALFEKWATSMSLPVLPTTTQAVGLYVAKMSKDGRKPGTITAHLAAITWMHTRAGWDSPTTDPWVTRVRAGAKRQHARDPEASPTVRAHPMSISELRRMIEAADQFLDGCRLAAPSHPARETLRLLVGAQFRALLLMSWFLGRRASELLEADISTLRREPETGAVWFTTKSQKMRPDGFGNKMEPISDPLICPARALHEWLELSEPHRNGVTRLFATPKVNPDGTVVLVDDITVEEEGWLRRHPLPNHASAADVGIHEAIGRAKGSNMTVKRYWRRLSRWMKVAGIQPQRSDRRLGTHSTRRGLVTELHAAGVDFVNISQHVGWTGIEMVQIYSDHESTESPLKKLDI